MNDIKLCICPICNKAFAAKMSRGRPQQVTCSHVCREKLAAVKRAEGLAAVNKLIDDAEKLRREPRTDCRAYDPESCDCIGLTGLWCTVETCKFYKKKD